jgi:transglutaminase-like putative cysteine protease
LVISGEVMAQTQDRTMDNIDKKYLLPTSIIDSDHERVIRFADNATGDTKGDQVEMAIRLYYAVRDGIWYDPYYPFYTVSARRLFYARLEGHAAFLPGSVLPMSVITLPRDS